MTECNICGDFFKAGKDKKVYTVWENGDLKIICQKCYNKKYLELRKENKNVQDN